MRTSSVVLFAGACACSVLGTLRSQAPTLLRDLNPDAIAPIDSTPGNFAQLGNEVLFAAETPASGRELWALDLSSRQVRLVLDIHPGSSSSTPHELTAMGGFVYFVADDGVHGREVMRTDGTATGTTVVVDLLPSGGSGPRNLLAVGNLLYFTAYSNAGNELVVSDGTAAGTVVIDIYPGTAHSLPGPLTAVGSDVYFRADSPGNGIELWRSSGTMASTYLVRDLVPGPSGSWPSDLCSLGNLLLFESGQQIWSSDGTAAGTVVIHAGTDVTSTGTQGYFAMGNSLYATDGTAANTQFITSISIPGGSVVLRMGPIDQNFFVTTTTGFFGGPAVSYVSDGTQANTQMLPTVIPEFRATLGSSIYFGAGTVTAGSELWASDGTLAGTSVVSDVLPGPLSSSPQSIVSVATTSELVFAADSAVGRELWSYDTGAGSSTMVANIADETQSTYGSAAAWCVDAGGIAYFAATDGFGAPRVLWKSDGTTAGTVQVVPPGPLQPTGVNNLHAAGTKVFFEASNSQVGNEVWVSDGTAAGTFAFDTFLGASNSNPSYLTVAEDWLYFLSYNPVGGRSLWRTDGTPQGLIAVSAPYSVGVIDWMEPLGRGLVFSLNPFGFPVGEEPFYTDGTSVTPLGDLVPGASGSAPEDLVALGPRCFFTTQLNSKLMVTDGTPAGTYEFLAGVPGAPDYFDRLFVVRNRLFFAGRTAAHGVELWVSDGTPAGTQLVRDVNVGPDGVSISPRGAMGDVLLYRASFDAATRFWRSDGTAAGTYQLLDQDVLAVTAAGERRAFFSASDDVNGSELWQTDGTVAGTSMVANLMPNDLSSFPRDLAVSSGRLFFSAEHPQKGLEPWVMELEATSQDIGYGCTPTTSNPPLLWSDDPVLGTTIDVSLAYGPDPGLSVLLISNHTTQAFPLGTGVCDYFVDPNALVFGFTVTTAGNALHPLTIPNTSSLDGLLLRMQGLTIPATGLFGAELSNGVTLSLGQ